MPSDADPLCELHAPSLEGRPLLCLIKKDGRGLEQVGSEKPVAIEAAASPADASWANINAINDVARAGAAGEIVKL